MYSRAIAWMTVSSDLRPFSVISRIKAITVLKRDETKVETIPRLLACLEVDLEWVHHCMRSWMKCERAGRAWYIRIFFRQWDESQTRNMYIAMYFFTNDSTLFLVSKCKIREFRIGVYFSDFKLRIPELSGVPHFRARR